METTQLIDFWQTSYKQPGWLRRLEMDFKLCLPDVGFLENFSQEQMEIDKRLEREYQKSQFDVRQKILDFMAEMSADKEAKQARTDYLNQRLTVLKQRLKYNCDMYSHSKKKGIPLFLRNAVWEINKSNELIKEIKKAQGELNLDKYVGKSKHISQVEIEQALDRPIRAVVEACGIKVINDKAVCPFHPDKEPSLYLKGTFAYCFGCKKSLNAIEFLREYKGMTFQEAIQWLKN
jgi:hypothetical protein